MDPEQTQAKTETKPAANNNTTPIIRTAEPNNMQYTDDKGIKHSIYLPQGTMHTACELLQNKQWDELATKFEPYTNQGYTEDDFKVYEESHNKQGDSRRYVG